MLIRILLFFLLATPAFAQDASLRYATFADLPTAKALSASAWQAVQCQPQPTCDPAGVTQYNYPIIGLSNLTGYAIVIHSGDVYQGEHLVVPNYKVATIASGTYTSGSGAVTLTTAKNHGFGVGASFTLSGMTGTGSFASLNGTFVTTAGTTGTTLNFTAATGLTLTIAGGTVGVTKSFDLTANQIASLQTRAQIGTLLPDILPIALVGSRVLPAETTAINTYANAHASFKANYTTLISGPIDLENPLTNTVFNELVANAVLTADRVAVILAPQAASVVQ